MPKFDSRILNKHLVALIFLESLVSPTGKVLAADWGYDGSTPPKDSTPSVFAGKHVVEPATTKTPTRVNSKSNEANPFGRQSAGSKPTATGALDTATKPATKSATKSSTLQQAPAKGTSASATRSSNQPEQIDLHAANKAREAHETAVAKNLADKERKVVNDWLDLYALVAQEHKLSDDQRERFSKDLAKLVNGADRANFEAILVFWPLVQKSIKNNAEQKDNYRSLFKALFRSQQHTGALTEREANIFSEILGPERIAVPGTPNLTEEACDAYGDMACFMYSQNNPGKTIDAMDNRTIFSSVIQRKFTDAPSIADKQSMANFALKWGKFKVLFADANDAQKEQLADQITGKAKGSKKPDVPNASIENIMTHGPWMAALNNIAKAPKTATTGDTTAQDSKDLPQGEAAKAGALTDVVAPHK